MGGEPSTTIVQPQAPAPPTVTSSIEDYIKNIPALFASAQEFQPQFAALQQQIQRQTSPLTAGLQESLAGQAIEGMEEPVPEWMREEYQRNIRSQLGEENVGSRIGADYMSRGLIAQGEQRRMQNQQLALSLAGRQQLAQAPSQSEMLGGFNTGQSLGFNQGVFGTQANIYGTQANMFNQQGINQVAMRGQNMDMISSGMDMVGGLGMAGIMASSITLKENVKPVSSALEKIEQLDGVLFDWKESKQADGGVIAEELERVIPEAVTEVNGIKHIKPMMIIAYLIEAVKELASKEK